MAIVFKSVLFLLLIVTVFGKNVTKTVLPNQAFIINAPVSITVHDEFAKNKTNIKGIGKYDNSLYCGIRGNRIVGGYEVGEGEFPWQISLQIRTGFGRTHICGGSIVNEYWVATAAHCVEYLDADSISIVAGDYNLYEEEGYEQRRDVVEIVSHSFDGSTFSNDIALLKLYYPLDFYSTSRVAPVCLPDYYDTFYGEATVTGWGRLYENGDSPYILHQVTLPIINKDECNQGYRAIGFSRYLNQCQICAGEEYGGRDACQGDSGGPLVCTKDDGRSYLCGIVSWGIGCARPYHPGVYTEVACYVDWIQYVTENY